MPRSTLSSTAPPGRRLLAALGAGLVLALGLTAPAYAHDELRSSNPADGATLAQPPAEVVLTFEEPPVDLGLQVVVTGPDGSVSSGDARIQGDDVVQTVQPQAPAGRYSVEWRVTSDDGHPVSGRFAFTAEGAATGASAGATPSGAPASTPAATPAPADAARRDPLIPSWAWIVAGVIVIAGAIRLNRRASAANKQQED
ncbi:hypothetical protein SAMN04488544_3793 [Microlunatus sagamiharensis]|uniref:CopC domain-containing protein n=1 Tax=Microlunatus sagamiharensis TaxID=546874 RepID=A0A1H2NDC4_9ACTN|nr:copper resistance CopC family protein [Microlunatus sagamiharensis]SDV03410.1 hypothetical protein SAMN04488544_3793 [Microlunatus sagamiharensis]